ncbi:hypothetical protein BD311DRAFT_805934 [Dichomitus squalens]|uniref:Uncharacterized protein n=1 Tax=Dichomitus squalens TaxID=114155 RepID=A0A4Q9MS35_9APHY|nr:hypothetical protein BD311DRAFT_805934 [Dichomitus squalens]
MEKANPVVLSVMHSHMVSEVFLGWMKSSMPSLRYMETVVNDGACGRASMQWQTLEDWVVRNLDIIRQTSLVGLCISYTGAGSTSTISAQHRNRIIHIARLLTWTISTLRYIDVGRRVEAGRGQGDVRREGMDSHDVREKGTKYSPNISLRYLYGIFRLRVALLNWRNLLKYFMRL